MTQIWNILYKFNIFADYNKHSPWNDDGYDMNTTEIVFKD